MKSKLFAYVIDSECRVVYFNKKMEVAFPHLGNGHALLSGLARRARLLSDCPLILDHASKSRVYKPAHPELDRDRGS